MSSFLRRLAGILALLVLACAATVATGQPAPTTTYTSFDAMPGKALQIGFYGTANKKDCVPARAPTIRVIEPPKAGSLMVRHGEVTAEKVGSCGPFQIPVQAILYTARHGDADSDRLIYEVTSANGQVATYQITIRIKPSPAAPAPTLERKT